MERVLVCPGWMAQDGSRSSTWQIWPLPAALGLSLAPFQACPSKPLRHLRPTTASTIAFRDASFFHYMQLTSFRSLLGDSAAFQPPEELCRGQQPLSRFAVSSVPIPVHHATTVWACSPNSVCSLPLFLDFLLPIPTSRSALSLPTPSGTQGHRDRIFPQSPLCIPLPFGLSSAADLGSGHPPNAARSANHEPGHTLIPQHQTTVDVAFGITFSETV